MVKQEMGYETRNKVIESARLRGYAWAIVYGPDWDGSGVVDTFYASGDETDPEKVFGPDDWPIVKAHVEATGRTFRYEFV